jgi:hypothetical protein
MRTRNGRKCSTDVTRIFNFFGNFMGLIYVNGTFLGTTKGCFSMNQTREKYLLRNICSR